MKKQVEIEYSLIREKLFGLKPIKVNTHSALITHFLQKKEKLNFHSKSVKTVLNGYGTNLFQEPQFRNTIKVRWDVPFPPRKNPSFRFIDLFAGIGGFRIALQRQNGKCVFSSEKDNAAQQTYERNFGEYPFGDIRAFTGVQVTDEELDRLIPDHEVLTAGFPCQPFSLAGVSARNFLGQLHGFSDTDKGNLFFDIARIVDVKKPKVVFLENVKNFKGHDKGNTFKTVKNTMEDLGYHFYSATINAQTWVPQQRQRFYMVCIRKKRKNEKPPVFEFPKPSGVPLALESILEENVEQRFTISDKLWIGHINRTKRNLARGTGFSANTADISKPSKTLVARYGKDGKECLIPQDDENPRMLTPRECARLQGFPEEFILPPSLAPAYKQFGNSVAVPVIEAIGFEIAKQLARKKRKARRRK